MDAQPLTLDEQAQADAAQAEATKAAQEAELAAAAEPDSLDTDPDGKRLKAVPKKQWLRHKGTHTIGHLPNVGTGPDGLFTPTDVAAYFTPWMYEDLVRRQGLFAEVAAPDKEQK